MEGTDVRTSPPSWTKHGVLGWTNRCQPTSYWFGAYLTIGYGVDHLLITTSYLKRKLVSLRNQEVCLFVDRLGTEIKRSGSETDVGPKGLVLT